jgi:hypothetical protein
MSSSQVPSGVLIGGPWGDVIIAEWGDLEITFNPYATLQSGVVGVNAFMTCDAGFRYPAVWSIATGVT